MILHASSSRQQIRLIWQKGPLYSLKQLCREHPIIYALTATLHAVKYVTPVTLKTEKIGVTDPQLMPA